MQLENDKLGQTWSAIHPGLTIGDHLNIADQPPQGGGEHPALNSDLVEYWLGNSHIGFLKEMWRTHPHVRPSTSLRYAQDERFQGPFVLSVTRRVKSKYERRYPQVR
jgi:hypothetical protein